MDRRKFINYSLLAGATAIAPGFNLPGYSQKPYAAIPITQGPKQHWFGYYDKWQVSHDGRYALGGEVDPFLRTPTEEDVLNIGLIDLENGNSWKQIGTSHAWGWQQGCMLQWIPGSSEEVIWNDREGDRFVSRVYNVRTGKIRTLPRAIYTLSPDAKYALCVDFDRLQFFRPGYGYTLDASRNAWEKAPKNEGIYRMDLTSGESKLILSYAAVAGLPRPLGSVTDNYQWFNHLLINPSGDRFIFLNRSRPVPTSAEMSEYRKKHPNDKKGQFSGAFLTRALTANTDGSDLYALNDSGQFSHFIWQGDYAICAWAAPEDSDKDAFYVFRDKSKKYEVVDEEAMPYNGHNTYVPGTHYEWILNDTYPQGEERMQELYLYHVRSKRKVVLGKFHEPRQFTGEWRCDLHPRCDPQGKRVFFDSTHEGGKRQMYVVDISSIVA